MDTSRAPEATTPQTTRDALLQLVDLARRDELTLVDGFDADARAAVGTVERWAPKDHFAHLGVWGAYQARRVEALRTGETPTRPADNDAVFLEHRDEPWEAIWANLMRALDDSAAALRRASDEELLKKDENGRSLYTLTVNNIYLHPISHLAQLYAERADDASAAQVQRESVTTMARLFGKEDQYANAVYNLGCYYALHGQPTEAIAQLREALTVNPTLSDAMKDDVDLVSLHDLPEYQALFTA
jgi:tetratricopeptide (TPR) repeat protein